MKITLNLYFNVICAFCIAIVCPITQLHAIEISPIVGFGQENFSFEVAEFDPSNKNRTVNFQPNIAGVTRLGANAFGFGFGYSFRGTEKSNDVRKGNTTFSDFQFGYQSKNWGIDTFYQTYQGFYTNNTVDIQSFPNLKFNHIGVMGRYALQESEFTVGSIVDQSDEIKGDAGKLYLVGGIRQHQFSTDTSILQQELTGVNTELELLRKLNALSINLGIGYGHRWLYSNKMFTGVLFDLIGTYANYNLETTTQSSTKSDITISYNIKLAGGYVGANYRFGLGFNGDVTSLKTNSQALLKPSAGRVLIYLRYVF